MSTVSSKNRINPDPILASDSYYNTNTIYNEKINTKYVDVSENDISIMGQLVKSVTSLVGGLFSPKRLIVVFRLLKALTFCCLCLTVTAELIYLFIVEFQVTDDVLKKIGGTRDELLRIYGIGLALSAIFIELDMTIVDIHYPYMRAFLPRSMLLMFVTAISGVTPIIGYENLDNTDDGVLIANEVPRNAVAFQVTTNFFLFLSACIYFFMGILCLDRFTCDAFLSNDSSFRTSNIINNTVEWQQSRGDLEITNDAERRLHQEYRQHNRVKSCEPLFSTNMVDETDKVEREGVDVDVTDEAGTKFTLEYRQHDRVKSCESLFSTFDSNCSSSSNKGPSPGQIDNHTKKFKTNKVLPH